MTAVVLGVDIGSKALGLALVEFEPPHRPVWADVVSIDRPDGGWAHQQIGAALAVAENPSGNWPRGPLHEICRVVIEDPPHVHGNVKTLKVLTAVATRVHDESVCRWPWAPVIWQTPGEWKKATTLKGNATKDGVKAWAATSSPRPKFASLSKNPGPRIDPAQRTP